MLGKQEPDYAWCAPYSRTQGPLACELADAYGIPPHPWQRRVLGDWLALDGDGRLMNSLCVLPVPRQNGKTGDADPRCTEGLLVRHESILYTAQEFQTSNKAFDRLRAKFGTRVNDPFAEFPELNAKVSKYTTSANQMVLDLVDGGHIEFRTRGTGDDVGRGGTFDLLLVDEAQSYTEEQDAALSPLVAAAPHGEPQTILMGTVPNPEKPWKGSVFARARNSLHEAPYAGACIHEWGASEVGDVSDRARWYAHNPSLGYQLLEQALEADAKKMLPEKFAMEHLGWWPPYAGKVEPAISRAEWDACAIDGACPGEADAFGIKFSPDGRTVAVSAAIRMGDGSFYVELVGVMDTARGTARLARAVRTRPEAVYAIDGKSGVRAFIERVGKGGEVDPSHLVEVSAADAVSAASGFLNAVREVRVSWCRAVGAELAKSVGSSPKRRIGAAGGWGFDGDYAAPVESAALAVWAADALAPADDMEVYF